MSIIRTRFTIITIFVTCAAAWVTFGLGQEAAVVEQARAEGSVVLYFTSPTEEGTAILEAFRAKYPFIRIDFSRAAAGQMVERVEAEQSAGVYAVDVFYFAKSLVPGFVERGYLASYHSDAADGIEDVDPLGYYTAARYYGLAPMYNPNLVPEDARPTDWLDFITPRAEWMNNLGVVDPVGTASGHATHFALLEHFGEDVYRQILQGVASANPAVYRTNTPGAEAVVSGEYPVLFNNLYDRYLDFNVRQGAPLEMVYPTSGMIMYTTVVAIAERAPNPAAARLLYDFIVSPEGQQVLADLGNYPARSDIEPEHLRPLDEIARITFNEFEAESDENKLLIQGIWQEIIGR